MNVAKEWMMLVFATIAMCAGATQPNQCPATSPDGIWILVGTDPSKCNAQAARCTVGINVNGWDRISSTP